MDKGQRYIILSLGLYFGWLLAVPFNGPIMHSSMTSVETNVSIPILFMCAHALGMLILGLLVKRADHWRHLLFYGGRLSLILGLLVFFIPLKLWSLLFVLLGFASSMFVLGWSYPYAVSVNGKNRMKHMALTIILANLIYVLLSVMLSIIPLQQVYLVALLFLAGAIKVGELLVRSDIIPDQKNYGEGEPSFPGVFVFITCLLIFGLYINGGFMYQVMYPSLVEYEGIAVFYRNLPYILVLAVMWRWGDNLHRQLPIYLGVSCMGLAFIAFSLLHTSLLGFFLIETLIQASFAFLDLFFFTILGDIGAISLAPINIFGFGMASMVGAILVGALLGEQLMLIGERYHLFTAMFAFSSIFLTFLVIPYMFNKIDGFYRDKDIPDRVVNEPKTGEELIESIFGTNILTAREMEIAEHLLQGLSNKQIAAQLYVTENTLKTHIKNIYNKLQVKTRRELMSKVLENKDNHPLG